LDCLASHVKLQDVTKINITISLPLFIHLFDGSKPAMVFSMFDASMFSPVDGQGLMVVDLALELHRRAKVGLRDPWI
jgi:hypothetical protein